MDGPEEFRKRMIGTDWSCQFTSGTLSGIVSERPYHDVRVRVLPRPVQTTSELRGASNETRIVSRIRTGDLWFSIWKAVCVRNQSAIPTVASAVSQENVHARCGVASYGQLLPIGTWILRIPVVVSMVDGTQAAAVSQKPPGYVWSPYATWMPYASRVGANCHPIKSLRASSPNVNKKLKTNVRVFAPSS